jgi:urease accessory protein
MDRAGAAVHPLTGADARRPAAIGRHARLELVFERRGRRTVLAHCYAEPPLCAARAFDDGDGVHVILASSAPGIFGGDCFTQSVRVGSGARVRFTSQSSLQVHASAAPGEARLRAVYEVADEGILRCQWHPLIPFAASRCDQAIDIQLAGRAQLSWSDAFTTGRAARGERWAFESLCHQLAVRRDGRLEYLERYRIAPGASGMDHPWVAAQGRYFGTVLASGAPATGEGAEALHRTLQDIAGLHAAADTLGDRLRIVRLVSESAVPFHRARQMAEAAFCSAVCSAPLL